MLASNLSRSGFDWRVLECEVTSLALEDFGFNPTVALVTKLIAILQGVRPSKLLGDR